MTQLETAPPGSGSAQEKPWAAVRLNVRGQVQGVGLRPFVYRLAQECRLAGRVRNDCGGVVIDLEGTPEFLAEFQKRLAAEAPVADIRVTRRTVAPLGLSTFVIDCSDSAGPKKATIPPDLATCALCLDDLLDPGNRRCNYPFTNCTRCGPRYSIVEALPYDRPGTAMRHFPQCGVCDAEYGFPPDRRFHAQANTCAICGPRVELWDIEGKVEAAAEAALSRAAEQLRQGKIIALKGLGGFQLLVRADQDEPIRRLRQRKHRPAKPLAVMVPSLREAERLAFIGAAERHALLSPQNPIVLLERRPGMSAEELAPGLNTIGLFLPTTGLHHLLLAQLGFPVVATSGNRSEEPIVTDERAALDRLAGIGDAFLVHDRPIVRHVDDSVVRVIAGSPVTFRLGRGYAPLSLPALEGKELPPVLATGGHQKNAIAAWTGAQAFLAQHLGDLDGPETRAGFERLIQDLTGLYEFTPAFFACDLHPNYFTTIWAKPQRTIPVQHHHAHAVACMAEHHLLDREVLALTWDGTGFGPDGTIWGGEMLRARASHFDRLASLLPFPLPGGEAAIRHPGRLAVALCLMHKDKVPTDPSLLKYLGLSAREGSLLAHMVHSGLQTTWTSSVGRLFDAVAALVLGIATVSYEGEAAVRLEAAADPDVTESYPFPILAPGGYTISVGDASLPRGDWLPLWAALQADRESGMSVGVMAGKFHNALARWAAAAIAGFPHADVVLSGGCFQNRLLAERTIQALEECGRHVYCHGQVPPGDGGLAAGQLAVALARLDKEM